MSIPKKIHYCWFGRKPLPESAKKCMASWHKYLPDYEIVEWNEDNFDVNAIPYTAQAYSVGKYAFVSDYARFKILYEHGGLYFDTDVEVIRPMDDIIAAGPFMGFETDMPSKYATVNPGLGLGAYSRMDFYNKILTEYSGFRFLNDDGTLDQTTIVMYTTYLLQRNGLSENEGIQRVMGMNLYPSEYFNPLDDATGKLRVTPNTVSIHWYSKTWIENNSHLRTWCSRVFHRVFGVDGKDRIKRILLRK